MYKLLMSQQKTQEFHKITQSVINQEEGWHSFLAGPFIDSSLDFRGNTALNPHKIHKCLCYIQNC